MGVYISNHLSLHTYITFLGYVVIFSSFAY
jgi:hypothetical protein